jgi:hypothetical protein
VLLIQVAKFDLWVDNLLVRVAQYQLLVAVVA